MKKIISILLFAVVLLSGCTGEKKNQESKDPAGQTTVVTLVDILNTATQQVKEASAPVDPQAVISQVMSHEIISEINKNSLYELTDKDRKLMSEAMDSFLSSVAAQYDTIPGSEAIKPVIDEMKQIALSNIENAKMLGDIMAAQ